MGRRVVVVLGSMGFIILVIYRARGPVCGGVRRGDFEFANEDSGGAFEVDDDEKWEWE